MIEKIKYGLQRVFTSRRIRVGCIAAVTAVAIAVGTLIGCSTYTVNIFDGENTYTVCSLNNNVASVLSGIKFKSDSYTIRKTDYQGRSARVEIAYSYPVYVTRGQETLTVDFTGGTVADALKLAGYTVDQYDFVEPSLDTVINNTAYIDYVDINYIEGSYTEAIPYSTETVYSKNLAKGQSKLTKGSEGLKKVNYTEKLVNGVSVEKNITGEVVLTAAVNAKKTVGTKAQATKPAATAVKTSADVKSVSWLKPAADIMLDANGNPVNFKSKMTVRATAYTYTGNNCSTGVAPKPGYIAVNPNVIPYGTKMYIKTADGSYIYGYAVAADTGGFIRKYPTGVDLFLTSESACVSFGVRNVEIYILE